MSQIRKQADSFDIQVALQTLIRRAPAGGLFHAAEMETAQRNAFCLRLDPDGPIFTVEVRYGGALTSQRESVQRERERA